VNGERHRGCRQLGDHVDAFDLIPAPRDGCGQVRLVLMVGGDHLDLLAEHAAAKILHRHLGGLERPFAAVIGIDAGLIVQNSDLDTLCRCRSGKQSNACRKGSRQQTQLHICLPKAFIMRIISSNLGMIFNNPAAAHLFQVGQ